LTRLGNKIVLNTFRNITCTKDQFPIQKVIKPDVKYVNLFRSSSNRILFISFACRCVRDPVWAVGVLPRVFPCEHNRNRVQGCYVTLFPSSYLSPGSLPVPEIMETYRNNPRSAITATRCVCVRVCVCVCVCARARLLTYGMFHLTRRHYYSL
jgi:hypothetical protein